MSSVYHEVCPCGSSATVADRSDGLDIVKEWRALHAEHDRAWMTPSAMISVQTDPEALGYLGHEPRWLTWAPWIYLGLVAAVVLVFFVWEPR